jgi:hypothetical protein
MDKQFRSNYKKFVTLAKKSNEEFATSTDAQKRVILAQDALTHATAGRLLPSAGSFGDETVATRTSAANPSESDLRENMVEDQFICQACARGGLVYSAIMRRNSVRGIAFEGGSIIPEFPYEMFQALETAFEANDLHSLKYFVGCPSDDFIDLLKLWEMLTDDISFCAKWATDCGLSHYRSTDDYRFRRVMMWIAEHEGEFDLLDFLKEELSRFPENIRAEYEADIKSEE